MRRAVLAGAVLAAAAGVFVGAAGQGKAGALAQGEAAGGLAQAEAGSPAHGQGRTLGHGKAVTPKHTKARTPARRATTAALARGEGAGGHRRPTVPGPSWDPGGRYVSTFHAGFNGTRVNPARWDKTWWVNPGNGNGISWSSNPDMTACYAASHDGKSGGYLRMRLDRTPNTCGTRRSYTGAVLDTHFSFSQEGGAFEARVFLPCNARRQVYGWPAWWTLDGTWTGEIDDVEGGSLAAGRAGGTAANLHYASQPPTGWVSGSPLCGWHDFGTQWNATGRTVTFYWDGRRVYSQPFPVGAGHPEYLIFDYQMFANGIPPPPRGATMLVDWARAWRVG
jgi:hypothetical protein